MYRLLVSLRLLRGVKYPTHDVHYMLRTASTTKMLVKAEDHKADNKERRTLEELSLGNYEDVHMMNILDRQPS
jgi:hypothetical protein